MRFFRNGVLSFLLLCLSGGPLWGNVPVHVRNQCPFTLWIHAAGAQGTLQPDDAPLGTNQSRSYTAPRVWTAARIEAYKDGPRQNQIEKVEATFEVKFNQTVLNYNVTYVDWVGLPVAVTTKGSGADCKRASCDVPVGQILDGCPDGLRTGDRCVAARSFCLDPRNQHLPYCHVFDAKINECASRYGDCAGARGSSTADVYACSGPFFSQNPKYCAAINRGMLHDPFNADKNAYYRNPPYNTYSKWVHDTCPGLYAFPYDDFPSHADESGFHSCIDGQEMEVVFCPGDGPGAAGSGPVKVYKDCGFTGSQKGLYIGRYTAADLQALGVSNDDISSLKVPAGYRVTLYEHDNFQGLSTERTTDQSCLGDEWNDRVSSLEIEASSPTVIAYKDCDFKGPAVNLPIGRYTMADLQKLGVSNDDVSSLRVQAGYRVTVYEHDNFQGASTVRTADQSCLGEEWNDRVSSLVVEVISPTALFYRDCDYGGTAVNLPIGRYTVAELETMGITNDDVSSLKVKAGYQVTLYENANFDGESTVRTADQTCLGEEWNDRTSSVVVEALELPAQFDEECDTDESCLGEESLTTAFRP